MKDNVDLTLNRVFRDNSATADLGDRLMRVISPFPWDIRRRRRLFSQRDLGPKKVELFFTGDKEERDSKKIARRFEEMYTHECDCCGRYINKYPWEKMETLCKGCDEMLSKSIKKFPWSNRRNR